MALFLAGAMMASLPVPAPRILLYYFHYERCNKTCANVEKASRDAVMTLYPVKVKRAEFVFKSYNLDEKEGAAMAAKYQVKGKTLILIIDDKRADLTRMAFKHADKHPEKIAEELKLAVENLLK